MQVGIIGCGRVAEERHLPAASAVAEVRLAAAADPDPARLDRVAGRYGIAQRFRDYRALLDRRDIAAVAILTPTPSHAEIALAALEAGKHVLLEKPLALTLAECDQLAARGAASAGKVVVCFNLRWHRLARRARELVAAGALGRVQAIRSVYTHSRPGPGAPDWHRRIERGGGVTFNEAVHHFDLWRWLLGAEVEEVYAASVSSPHYEDETSAVTARLAGGGLASGLFTLRSSSTSEVEILGESGRAALCLYRYDGLEFYPFHTHAGDLAARLRRAARFWGELPGALRAYRQGGESGAMFTGLWRHFAGCVEGNQTPLCTIEDGRRATRIAFAAVQSAACGRPVRIADGGP